MHSPAKCIINQREVGQDSETYSTALKSALREDPDIILMGEIRDLESMSIALRAAETGHLVFQHFIQRVPQNNRPSYRYVPC